MEYTYNGSVLRGSHHNRGVMVTPEEANAIVKAIMKYNYDLRQVEEANLRAAGQIWIASYMVHHVENTEEFFSLDSALVFLVEGAEEGHLSFGNGNIKCPDGRIIQGKELYDLADIYEGARDR